MTGCGGDSSSSGSSPKPKGGYATGKITFEDGSPITGDVQDYYISIYGVSEAGEKVNYRPIVKDGVYKQKLVPGQYGFSPCEILVKFGPHVLNFDLVPIGTNWNKNQDSADGIVQDFVWKPTGLAETYGREPDPNNATHWHGMSIGMGYQMWRSDINQASALLPEGTKLVFTLVPTSKGIDGRDLQTITVERDWRPNDITTNDGLNDIFPANYELTGLARLPDGSTRPILFQNRGDYPNFVPKTAITLERDNITGSMWKPLVGWVTD